MAGDLDEVFHRLLAHFGPSGWWPAGSAWEMMAGAVLTQATSWHNATLALARLDAAGLVIPAQVAAAGREQLEECVRPSGFYRQKAERLQALATLVVEEAGGVPEELFKRPQTELRGMLLAVPGIGPETCDSILLYGAAYPVFVIDAYTRRVATRTGLRWDASEISYSELQGWFMEELPADPVLYGEYHAQLVRLAKAYCRQRNPRCRSCPLRHDCLYGKAGGTVSGAPA